MNANTVVELLLEVTVKSSALVLLCWAATLMARRTSAAWKHALWTATIAASLLLFPLALLAPAWRVVPAPKVTPLVMSSGAEKQPLTLGSPTVTRRDATGKTATPVMISEQSRSSPAPVVPIPRKIAARRMAWQGIVVLVWLAGIAIMLANTSRAQLSVIRLVGRGRKVEDEAWTTALYVACERHHLKKPVTLLSSDDLDVPIVCGVLRAQVVVPTSATEWIPDRRLSVLMHELAHVKRGDLLTQWIGQVAVAIFWFNPAIWLAATQVRAFRERACDDLVLRYGTVPSEYAQELLSIVSGLGAREDFATALAMARRSQIEGRLLAILDPAARRRAMSRLAVSVLILAALAIVFPAAALKLKHVERVYAAQITVTDPPPGFHEHSTEVAQATQDPGASTSAARSESTSASRRAGTVAAPSDSPFLKKLAACTSEVHGSSNSNISVTDDNGKHSWIVKWSRGDCSINLNSEGTIKFNPNFTELSISDGGFFDLITRVGGETQRVRVEPKGSAVRSQYWRNGTEMVMDSQGEEWLRDAFIALDRQTAFAIDQRFPQLMNAGGPQRVLQEVKVMSADYARSMYLQRLVQQDLKTADVNGAINATLDMQSDYEIARVLTAVAQKYSLQESSTRTTYLQALDRLKSDYEHARVLMTFFSRTQIPPELARTVLESAAKLKSDYELARVLVEMADKQMVTKDTEADYVATVGHLKSDYEHARTLINYLERYGSDARRLGPVIDQAGQIRSDYEAARVLTTIAQYRPEGAQRDAYVRVANKIGSDYERKRALAAIASKPAAL